MKTCKPFSEKDKQYLETNYQKKSYTEMAVALGRNYFTITAYIARQPYYEPQTHKRFTEYDKQYLMTHYVTQTYEEMGKILGRSPRVLSNYMRSKGITRGSYLHFVNEHYFDTPNITNSYHAGFLAADGCLKKDNVVSIILSSVDRDQLEQFRTDCEFTGNIGEGSYKGKDGCTRNIVSLNICGANQWHKALNENFNITHRKTFTLQPPPLTDVNHVKAFIIGYADGDGSLFYRGDGYLTLGFKGTSYLLNWIKDFFDINYPAICNRVANVNPYNNICQYYISGKRAETILKDLYDIPVPKMARKWNKVKQLLSVN
jgi:hypothetical protein